MCTFCLPLRRHSSHNTGKRQQIISTRQSASAPIYSPKPQDTLGCITGSFTCLYSLSCLSFPSLLPSLSHASILEPSLPCMYESTNQPTNQLIPLSLQLAQDPASQSCSILPGVDIYISSPLTFHSCCMISIRQLDLDYTPLSLRYHSSSIWCNEPTHCKEATFTPGRVVGLGMTGLSSTFIKRARDM